MIRTIATIFALFFLLSCGNKGKNDAEPEKFEIKRPDVPAMLASERERAEYMALHFWDRFDFSDTTALANSDVLEQAFADYIGVLRVVPQDKAAKSLKAMLGKASSMPAMFNKFADFSEHYLHDPNSPMRSEELYIPVLEFIIASDKIDEVDKLRSRSQLEMAVKNRVGQKAADISMKLADGTRTTLYNTKANYVILYINNPDCAACAQVTAQLAGSPAISYLLANDDLRIFAVYPDEDITAWREHITTMPKEWINGYDYSLEMRDKETYDLKAIPSLYLLDEDKKVIIKDAAEVRPLEVYLFNNSRVN